MARIAGENIPNEKKIKISLTYIFGIGLYKAAEVLKKVKIDPETRTKDLTEDQLDALRKILEKEYKVEGNLKRDILSNIKRLKEIKSYRGSRHEKGLPVRGQSSKTNSRTARGGGRRSVGSGRKPGAQKT